MSATVEIRLDPALQELIRRGPQSAVLAAIARALDHENELTLGAAQKRRMSFPRQGPTTPEGLRVITNRLRRSLTRSRARIAGSGVLSAIGSNVRYFGVHEFGFEGAVDVRAHTRRGPRRFATAEGSIVNLAAAARAGSLTAAGAARKRSGLRELERGPQQVRAHRRQMSLPARRMVQRTLAERQQQYVRRIGAEVAQAVGGPGGTAA